MQLLNSAPCILLIIIKPLKAITKCWFLENSKYLIMELEEMTSLWNDMSQIVDQQKVLTDKLILDMTQERYENRLRHISIPETIAALICFAVVIYLISNFALLYSSGLRVGEVTGLQLSHIDIGRNQLKVVSGKGRKDRFVILAKTFLPLLNNYLSTYKPHFYFIEGPNRKRYSESSIRKFLYNSVVLAGIKKHVTPHTLRHSYATHLLENGVSLRHIQELLGHSKPETTMIYTHVAKKDLLEIQSPLDTILLSLNKNANREQKFLLSGNGNP